MKTFESNKNAKELGIDTTRKFVVVSSGHNIFREGDIVELVEDDDSSFPCFERIGKGEKISCCWYRLAYVNAEVLAKVQVKGKSIIQNDKECWSEIKLIKTYKWSKKDSVSLAIYAAELVLPNFEKEYPEDKRPRQAIEAAKKVLKNDTKRNKDAASAARSAAWSARSAADKSYSLILKKCHNFVMM